MILFLENSIKKRSLFKWGIRSLEKEVYINGVPFERSHQT